MNAVCLWNVMQFMFRSLSLSHSLALFIFLLLCRSFVGWFFFMFGSFEWNVYPFSQKVHKCWNEIINLIRYLYFQQLPLILIWISVPMKWNRFIFASPWWPFFLLLFHRYYICGGFYDLVARSGGFTWACS